MVIRKIWEKYNYVILLMVVSIICGLLYLNYLIEDDQESSEKIQEPVTITESFLTNDQDFFFKTLK